MSQQGLFGAELNNTNAFKMLSNSGKWNDSEYLISEYLLWGFLFQKPYSRKRSYFKKFNLSNSVSMENNKVNGKLFEIIGFSKDRGESNQ